MNEPIEETATPYRDAELGEQPEETRWIARRLHPVIVVYTLLVFAVFMAASQFVFHSPDAVKSLALAAAAGIVALLPQVFARIEYRADASGVQKRAHGKKARGAFNKVFDWDQLSHVTPTRNGFKYFLQLDEKNTFLRWTKRQFSDRYSGEIQVEKKDRSRIRHLLGERGVSDGHR